MSASATKDGHNNVRLQLPVHRLFGLAYTSPHTNLVHLKGYIILVHFSRQLSDEISVINRHKYNILVARYSYYRHRLSSQNTLYHSTSVTIFKKSQASQNIGLILQSAVQYNCYYIHTQSYSAQSYIKQSDCALQRSTHVQTKYSVNKSHVKTVGLQGAYCLQP